MAARDPFMVPSNDDEGEEPEDSPPLLATPPQKRARTPSPPPPPSPEKLTQEELAGLLRGDYVASAALAMLSAQQVTLEAICAQCCQPPLTGLAVCAFARATGRPLRDVCALAWQARSPAQQQQQMDVSAVLGLLPPAIAAELKSMCSGNAVDAMAAVVQLRDRLTAELDSLISTPMAQQPLLPSRPGLLLADAADPESKRAGDGHIMIPVFNEVDSEPYVPQHIKWIEELVFVDVKPVRDEEFLVGCTCSNCNDRMCSCARESHDATFPYDSEGHVMLIPRSCIYECNAHCVCADSSPDRCLNRVIQRGSKCYLEIFRTRGRGWGVRTALPIPAATYVCEYIGEVIGAKLAEERGMVQDEQHCSYLFDLDLEEEHKDDCPVIDAAKCGSVARFLNHCCEPNLNKYFFWVKHLDKRFPRVAFFTARNIAAGEELTFDYQYSGKRRTKDSHCYQCRCGAKNCRKVLF